MLFWALMASGQTTMRRVNGWQTLDQAPVGQPLDLAAWLSDRSESGATPKTNFHQLSDTTPRRRLRYAARQ